MKGIVFDIQRSALHDGPGLRTVVFLKGCPLRCAWCHNPESFEVRPQVGFSGKVYGAEITVNEIMKTVLLDREYYDGTGGGLTLSGGEPSYQFDFSLELLKAAQAENIHTCYDTCGQLPAEKLKLLIPYVDLFHFDWKVDNQADHSRWTDGNYKMIRANLDVLKRHRSSVVLRCPLVPGINDSAEHMSILNAFRKSGDFHSVEEIPFHDWGNHKYVDLGMNCPM